MKINTIEGIKRCASKDNAIFNTTAKDEFQPKGICVTLINCFQIRQYGEILIIEDKKRIAKICISFLKRFLRILANNKNINRLADNNELLGIIPGSSSIEGI